MFRVILNTGLDAPDMRGFSVARVHRSRLGVKPSHVSSSTGFEKPSMLLIPTQMVCGSSTATATGLYPSSVLRTSLQAFEWTQSFQEKSILTTPFTALYYIDHHTFETLF